MVFLISTLEEYFSFIDKIDPTTLFFGLVAFTWIVSLWEHYLSYRQVKFLVQGKFMLYILNSIAITNVIERFHRN